jgi:hypothetical protein
VRRIALVLTAALGLACGGAADVTSVAPAKSVSDELQGRWCENDPEVGCYRFEGSEVVEEPVNNKRGYSGESRGPWKIEGNMLIMTFPEGNWTLEIVSRTESVMVLTDHSQPDTFTFTKTK